MVGHERSPGATLVWAHLQGGCSRSRSPRSFLILKWSTVCSWIIETLTSGVAFHHAGLAIADRHAIEKGFLEGQINVICCTSTLAVGVNLPCHMVIMKNTVCFTDEGLKEYSDLEVMQMLGRAGR